MLAKFMTAGVVGSALLATVAFAQTPSATADSAKPATAASDASDTSFQGNWRGSKLVGLSVYNEANESLGSINDLLTDKGGTIKGVVIGVGGFLGVGEHLVALPFDNVKFVSEPVAYTGTAGAGGTGASGATGGTRPGSTTTTGAATTPAATPAKPNLWYPDHAVISATKDQLKAMPEFKYTI